MLLATPALLLAACAQAPRTPDDARTAGTDQEDCTDGVDNDGNGLLDCEDGACALRPPCIEDCGNGTDDDRDGLVDCQDDDCWFGAECHVDGVRVEILDGSMVHRSSTWRTDTPGSGYVSSARWGRTRRLDLVGVAGLVRTLPPGARWSTAGTSYVCGWSFASGWAEHGTEWLFTGVDYTYIDTFAAPATRHGFSLDTGCRLSGSSFLPRVLIGAGPGAYAALATRIHGTRTSTFTSYGTTTWTYTAVRYEPQALWYGGPTTRTDSGATYRSWEVAPLAGGGTWPP